MPPFSPPGPSHPLPSLKVLTSGLRSGKGRPRGLRDFQGRKRRQRRRSSSCALPRGPSRAAEPPRPRCAGRQAGSLPGCGAAMGWVVGRGGPAPEPGRRPHRSVREPGGSRGASEAGCWPPGRPADPARRRPLLSIPPRSRPYLARAGAGGRRCRERRAASGGAQRRPGTAGSPLMACRARSPTAAATAAASSSASSRAPSRDAAHAPAPQPPSPAPPRPQTEPPPAPPRAKPASGSQRRPAPGPGVAAKEAAVPSPL